MSEPPQNLPTTRDAAAAQFVEAGVRCLGEHLSEASETPPTVHGDGPLLSTSTVIWRNRLRTVVIGLHWDSQEGRAALAAMVADRTRESLCLCVLPNGDLGVWPVLNSPANHGAASAIPFYREDIEALERRRVDLTTLLEFKLYRRFVLDKPDVALRFHERSFTEYEQALRDFARRGFQPLEDVLRDIVDADEWVTHPHVQRITRALDQGRGALVVGVSSAGKSVLCFQTGRDRVLSGARVLYINLGATRAEPIQPLLAFLGHSDVPPDLLVIDDLQSNPGLAKCLLALSNLFRRASSSSTSVLATSWPDFALEASVWHEQCLPVSVQPTIIREAILSHYGGGLSSDIIQLISQRFGDDLLLLRLALEQATRVGANPLMATVAEELWRQRTSHAQVEDATMRRVALVAGSLGRYDISTPSRFLKHEARAEEAELQSLIESRLLRKNGAYISMGHRSLCALICDWLASKNAWRLLGDNGGPKDGRTVVLDYLKSLGSGLTVDSLRSLHARAGLKDRPQLNRRAIAVIEVWQAFDAIVERIERQQERDPTWNAVPSSAMFAIQALGEVGKPVQAIGSIQFLREHWKIESGQLEVSLVDLTTRSDFEGIRAAMVREDKKTPPLENGWAAANEIDLDRFHQTWFAGLVLCAEAVGHQPIVSVVSLAEAVERLQCESGAFYPERVPWSTARVLQGLAACGRTIDTSRAVQKAVSWLLKPHTEGGALRNGVWHSGTGDWNPTLETTSQVLLALAAVGFDMSDKRLGRAKGLVVSEKPRWTAAGSELAGALAIQAFLETGGAWEDVADETQRLSQWAKGKAFWEGATTTEKLQFEQTCTVAQIAWHLVAIGWVAIKADLPAFLDALTTPHQFRDDLDSAVTTVPSANLEKSPPEISVTTAAVSDFVLDGLREMKQLSLRSSVVVGKYMRHDERVRNALKDWCGRMSGPLTTAPTNIHENFLVWAAPGSGKSFLVQQLAEQLPPPIQYIELNLAAMKQTDIATGLAGVAASKSPVLCLLDEIDARVDEDWPYEEIFPSLDLNRESSHNVVFVLIGSRGEGREGMIARIKERPNGAERPKGKDLIDRVPADRRFEIPPPTLEDKAMIVAGHVTEAAKLRGAQVKEIEKMLLYYILCNEDLKSPRQLSDLARDTVRRLSIKEDRLRYDNLFEDGDTRNQRFFAAHLDAANELSGTFVRVEE